MALFGRSAFPQCSTRMRMSLSCSGCRSLHFGSSGRRLAISSGDEYLIQQQQQQQQRRHSTGGSGGVNRAQAEEFLERQKEKIREAQRKAKQRIHEKRMQEKQQMQRMLEKREKARVLAAKMAKRVKRRSTDSSNSGNGNESDFGDMPIDEATSKLANSIMKQHSKENAGPRRHPYDPRKFESPASPPAYVQEYMDSVAKHLGQVNSAIVDTGSNAMLIKNQAQQQPSTAGTATVNRVVLSTSEKRRKNISMLEKAYGTAVVTTAAKRRNSISRSQLPSVTSSKQASRKISRNPSYSVTQHYDSNATGILPRLETQTSGGSTSLSFSSSDNNPLGELLQIGSIRPNHR